MSRLLAYIANDPQRIRCALHPGREALRHEAADGPLDGWGFGFHGGGEVLLQRRPRQHSGELDFYELLGDLRTDVLIGHMRKATVGIVKNDNTHPFRFRSWIFAHHGTVGRWEAVRAGLLEEIPDFLRRNIRGETDSEHLFHLFLGQLHRAGKLDDAHVAPEVAGRAMAEALAVCDRLVGDGSSTLNMAASNGRILLATARGAPLHCSQISGIHECPVCKETPSGSGAMRHSARPFEHDHLRAVVLVGDDGLAAPRAPWTTVPEGSLVTVSHELRLEIAPLPATAT